MSETALRECLTSRYTREAYVLTNKLSTHHFNKREEIACTDEAKEEQNANVRPELTTEVDNFGNYDTVFLGYPNWWGDMPMPVYTFLESYDFSGKTVIPFCTHARSGLSGTVNTLKSKLNGATVLEGFAIAGTTAQNDQDNAKSAVLKWLGELDV